MFKNMFGFLRKFGKKEDTVKLAKKNKDEAKERLHLVLMQDRANVSADFMDLMRQEIIEVIKKYIDVDENEIDVKLTNKQNSDGTTGSPALYANIPIKSIKRDLKMETIKAAKKVNSEKKLEDVAKEEKVEDKKEKKEEVKEPAKSKLDEMKDSLKKPAQKKATSKKVEKKVEAKPEKKTTTKKSTAKAETKKTVKKEVKKETKTTKTQAKKTTAKKTTTKKEKTK